MAAAVSSLKLIIYLADNYAWVYANRMFQRQWGWPDDHSVAVATVDDTSFTPGNDELLGSFVPVNPPPNCVQNGNDFVCEYVGETYDEWLLDNGYACDCTEDGCSETSPSCCADSTCPTCSCNEDGCTDDSPSCCADGACLWAS